MVSYGSKDRATERAYKEDCWWETCSSWCPFSGLCFFFFSSRRRHTRYIGDWSSDCALPIWHRVIEAYLAEALGYPWDRVHAEAERLEHAASDELVDRMAATIGEPEVDPHGAPIPTRDGGMDETEYKSLAELPVGASGVVARVADEDPEMLRYLAELSILPGKRITVRSRAPYDGPITLAVGRQELSIGPALAVQVLIAPLADRAGKRG